MKTGKLLGVVTLLAACSTNPPPDEDRYVIGTGAELNTTICPDKKYMTVINKSNAVIDLSYRYPYNRSLIALGQVGTDRVEEFELPKGVDYIDYRASNEQVKRMPNGIELRFSCTSREPQ